MKMHHTLTTSRIIDAAQNDDNTGFCVACGADAYSVEPDARKYECEECGERAVYGAEELILSITG